MAESFRDQYAFRTRSRVFFPIGMTPRASMRPMLLLDTGRTARVPSLAGGKLTFTLTIKEAHIMGKLYTCTRGAAQTAINAYVVIPRTLCVQQCSK